MRDANGPPIRRIARWCISHFGDESVSFGEGRKCNTVLNGVGFTFLPSEVVALVGRSGEGKNTAANLLLRF